MIKLVVLSVLLALAVALPKNAQISLVKDVHPNIIGGKEAEPHSVPWQARIWIKEAGGTFCSGALISSKYVLTNSPYCAETFINADPKNVSVTLGAHNITENEDTQRTIGVKRIITNDTFKLGLIELETEVAESDAIKFAVLSDDDDSAFILRTGQACGWGMTEFGNDVTDNSDVLICLKERIISYEKCNESWGSLLLDGSLCLNEKHGVLSCYGDEGAPVSVNGKVIGIAYGFCFPGIPFAINRITSTKISQWIQNISDDVV